jgi:aspartate kinase
MIVMKFGGSSIGDAEGVRRAARLIAGERARKPVVVVSAHGKTTDTLIRAARDALGGVVDTSGIERTHAALCDDLDVDVRAVEPLLQRLSQLLHGICLLRELTPRTLDHVMSFGERMSTRVMAAVLAGEGVAATAVNAWDMGLVTTGRHGAARPLPGVEERIRERAAGYDLVPVVTGFLGRDERGEITTLGRSGSDLTASVIGAAVGAEEVQIWTDVDGVMTCDPTLDPRAEHLPVLSFDEASELAYYGAEVLHPSTLVPAVRAAVPVRVLNTSRPGSGGTTIVAEPVRGDRIAKSVVYKEHVCMLGIASPRLMSAVEVLTRAFGILEQRGIDVHMATTSEASVSMVTDSDPPGEALSEAVEELRALGPVEVQREQAVICVVGEELRGSAGVTGRIFGAVEAGGIKPRMISQSSSEINVAFLVPEDRIPPAVTALHGLLLDSSKMAADA